MTNAKLFLFAVVGILATIIIEACSKNLSPCDYCKSIQNSDSSNEISDEFYRKVINSNLSPHEFCAQIDNLCGTENVVEKFGTKSECAKCLRIANNLIIHIHMGRHNLLDHAGELGCAGLSILKKVGCKLWLVGNKSGMINAILQTHNNPKHACILMHQC